MSTQRLSIAVIGAGERGTGFGNIVADQAHLAEITAVAEPRQAYREAFASRHGLKSGACFASWEDFLSGPKRCDAVIIATQDKDHRAPAVAALDKGYQVLLEKPMATSLEDCRAIEAAQRKSGAIMAICHSLRYNHGFAKLKSLLDSGAIGKLMTLDHIEQVSYWLMVHGFVRGNWRREEDSTFMLMAKSCHDLDYMSYLVGKDCLRVASYGSLSHFRPENAPQGATERCTDGCPLEPSCPYSALKIYVNCDRTGYPALVVSPDHSQEAHMEALRTKPWGRCVWRSDNDVVDHQVAMLEYEGGVTGTFTMSAFTKDGGRRTRLNGSEGEMHFDEAEGVISLKRFDENAATRIQLGREKGGHGGGDVRVVRNWLQALRTGDRSSILSSAQESLKTHTLVFAAEKSRREGRMVALSEFAARA